jgi:hypothetical protein
MIAAEKIEAGQLVYIGLDDKVYAWKFESRMKPCEFLVAELRGQSPPSRIILRTTGNARHGVLEITALRDCHACKGTGEIRSQERMTMSDQEDGTRARLFAEFDAYWTAQNAARVAAGGYDEDRAFEDFDSHEDRAAYYRKHAGSIVNIAYAKSTMLNCLLNPEHREDWTINLRAEAFQDALKLHDLIGKLLIGFGE